MEDRGTTLQQYCQNAIDTIDACMPTVMKNNPRFGEELITVRQSLEIFDAETAIRAFESLPDCHRFVWKLRDEHANDTLFMVILDSVFRAMGNLRLFHVYGMSRQLIDLSPAAVERAAKDVGARQSAIVAYISRHTKLK